MISESEQVAITRGHMAWAYRFTLFWLILSLAIFGTGYAIAEMGEAAQDTRAVMFIMLGTIIITSAIWQGCAERNFRTNRQGTALNTCAGLGMMPISRPIRSSARSRSGPSLAEHCGADLLCLTTALSEALGQQTATSEVLQVISTSPGELEPVFQTILQNATRICAAHFGTLLRFEDGAARIVSKFGIPPAFAEFLGRGPYRPVRSTR